MFVRRRGLIPYALLAAGLAPFSRGDAAPALTTIQDVLYKADGTRFSGTAAVTWRSFEASDRSAITMHAITVRIVGISAEPYAPPVASLPVGPGRRRLVGLERMRH